MRIYLKGCKADIYAYEYPLPGIREVVRQNEDGSYTILVSDSLHFSQKLEALNHAIRHIMREDWSGGDVGEIERKCHAEETQGRQI